MEVMTKDVSGKKKFEWKKNSSNNLTDKNVLESEKNNYGRVSRNQNMALTNTRTLKTRAMSQQNGKQD